MRMTNAQKDFLLNSFFEQIMLIPSDKAPAWGKMGLQQMIEHLSDSVRMANGKQPHAEIVTPAERLQAVRDFLYSEREFKPETKNSLMGPEPPSLCNESLDLAIAELQHEVKAWVELFESNPGLIVRNPFFGDLDEDGWTRLFYKHFLHHLKQFS